MHDLSRAKSYGAYIDAAEHAFAQAVRALPKSHKANKAQITVRSAGPTASVALARGQIILTLPGWPRDKKMSRGTLDRLTGLWVHEFCHVAFTDFDQWREAVAAKLSNLVNGLEDARIEAEADKRGLFVDMPKRMADLFEVMGEELGADLTDMDPNDPRNLSYVLSITGRAALGNGDMKPAARRLLSAMTPETSATVRETLEGLKRCKSTGDVVELARKLAAKPAPETPPTPESKPKSDEEGQSGPESDEDGVEGAEGAQDGAEGQSGPESDEEGQSGAGTPGEGAEGDEADDGATEPAERGEGTEPGTAANNPQSLGDLIDDTADTRSTEARAPEAPASAGDGRAQHAAHEVDKLAAAVAKADPATLWGDDASGIYNRKPGSVDASLGDITNTQGLARVRESIRRSLLAEDRSDVERGTRRGRFDVRAWARFESGARNVMKRRHEEPGESAAVLILLDASASMGDKDRGASDRRRMAAAVMAYTTAQAVENAGGKVEIWAYGGSTHALREIKTHRQRMNARAAMKNLGLYSRTGLGGTPLLGATMAACRRLALFGARADRRVLVTLTDGLDEHTATLASYEHDAAIRKELGHAPDAMANASARVLRDHIEGAMREALDRAGAELLGVILGDDLPENVPHPFPAEARVVRTAGDRQTVAADVLRELDGRKRRAAA